MITSGAPNVNAIEREKVRGPKLPSVPRQPSIPAIGVNSAMPRYKSFRAPKTIGLMKVPKVAL